jgi:hypothetical protein
MAQETDKKYWQEAYCRFQLIDWELPVSKEEVDELHATLPKRPADESITTWLERILEPKPFSFTPFTQIIRRAASSSLEQYPLPDVDSLLTEDDSLCFKIYSQNRKIFIKVKALGIAIDDLANCILGIADHAQPEYVIAVIPLDSMGSGEICLDDTLETRRALLNPLIGRIND